MIRSKQIHPSEVDNGRDNWLTNVAAAMAPWYEDLGFPLPQFRISHGFPSTGGRSRETAETWLGDEGEPATILIRPDVESAFRIAAALAFQLARLAAGDRDEHGHLFRHIAVSIGLPGRKTEVTPSRLFAERIQPILEQAGDLPTPVLGLITDGQQQKQKTRQIKVLCKECGYVARVSRKWLKGSGAPHCPQHGAMQIVE